MTDECELKALEEVYFQTTYSPNDVWQDCDLHVEGPHAEASRIVRQGLKALMRGERPDGIVIEGRPGSGKTHFLGRLRSEVIASGEYFVLLQLISGTQFWQSAALAYAQALTRKRADGQTQLQYWRAKIAQRSEFPGELSEKLRLDTCLSLEEVNKICLAARAIPEWSHVRQEMADCLRALLLFSSDDPTQTDIGYSFLQSIELEREERQNWGFLHTHLPPQKLVGALDKALALTGRTVVAIDQLDLLISVSDRSEKADDVLIDQVAGGLMDLRDEAKHALVVVSCLTATWTLIKKRATASAPQRYPNQVWMDNGLTPKHAAQIISARLAPCYRRVNFEPPYPTWPVRVEAFAGTTNYNPRELMQRIQAHIHGCLRNGKITELSALDQESSPDPIQPPQTDDLSRLDARFTQLKDKADVTAALSDRTEDKAMSELLFAGLVAWIAEGGEERRDFFQDPPPGAKPALHARLRRSLGKDTEDETHWAFRAIASDNAIAALNRIRAACTMAGLDQAAPKHKLILLRNNAWSTGTRTRDVIKAFEKAGGVTLTIAVEDLKVFAALKAMLAERPRNLEPWLAARSPASNSLLFQAVFGDFEKSGVARPPRQADQSEAPLDNRESLNITTKPAKKTKSDRDAPTIPLGETVDTRTLITIGLESLRKHAAIFAGSGSGKTVLIRRLVEECALQGVSAIVLDPNNDLARLGDQWPADPKYWGSGDHDKAKNYFADTEIVVWTPRRETGRPLSFQPLPDFAAVLDDADEFGAAIDAAVAALAPRANVAGRTNKAALGQAVLRETLRYFAQQGGAGLKSFIDLLSVLPEGVSAIDKANKIATEVAQTLTAAMINDPLFGGDGAPVDPGLLLTPAEGKKARVSVISFIGLPSDEQRQSFVNQLQMALFAWVKKNPAGERPLGGLFVMDEAQTLASSGAMTACTLSTITLASQARKYGLGLVFATQAPKGLHNQIPGNAATQFFGFLNSQVQIETAKKMAREKGGDVPNISRLKTGQFYTATEGQSFLLLQAPLCLSHHPKSPLTTEEVLDRAKKRV